MTNLFKPKVSLLQPSYPAFSGGGLTRSSVGGLATVSPTGERTDTVAGLAGAGAEAANTFGGLYDTVQPGFNSLLDARLNQINDAARSSIGDLRTNLQSRRILGSSFGNDTINRNQAEFARLRDQAVASNFLQSLDAQQKLA